MPRRKKSYDELGIPAGTKTQFGWLLDDGYVDPIAVWLAAKGIRRPDLTRREAVHACVMIVNEVSQADGTQNRFPHNGTIGAEELVQFRLQLSRAKASALMTLMRQMRQRGEL